MNVVFYGCQLYAEAARNLLVRLAGAHLLAFAERNDLALRYGATGGGNDGSVFRTGNSAVLPLAIPLRYAHTAVETIDTQDLIGLVRLLRAMVRDVSWIE